MLSHRVNVRTSKFWRKSKETKQNFFRKFTNGISGFDLGKKRNSKISNACVPLKKSFPNCNKHRCKKSSKIPYLIISKDELFYRWHIKMKTIYAQCSRCVLVMRGTDNIAKRPFQL